MHVWFTLLGLMLAAQALAQTRLPISTQLEVSSTEIFGGAIGATFSVSPPDPYSPSVLNGVPESGVADLRVKVGLNYLAEGQLGSRNIGEFVPYQKVTIRIENLSTLDPENTVEFDLAPAVSASEGWHYASEVRLPPVDSELDLLSDEFRVSIVSISWGSVALHADAQPASKLFRPTSATDTSLLFDDLVDLSLARSLPHGSLVPKRPKEIAPDSPLVWGLLALFASRRFRAQLLGLCALGACKVEPLFSAVPTFTQLVLVQDKPVSGGAMLATLSLETVDVVDFPSAEEAPLPGGNENIKAEESDLYLQLDLRYAAALQGGQKINDFVPYMIVEASIENLDTKQSASFFLIPHASIKDGYHYGRNVRLAQDLGLSEVGYAVSVKVNPPALLNDIDLNQNELGRSPLSPGVIAAPDFSPFTNGTLFSLKPLTTRSQDAVIVQDTFTLFELIASNTTE
jgi:uncharacterized protein involved in high-affinity Fe2+ transport